MNLFGAPDPDPSPAESPGAARTRRRNARGAAGRHPVAPTPADTAHQCGGCARLRRKRAAGYEGYKCAALAAAGHDGPDIRVSWPACAWWKDAAR